MPGVRTGAKVRRLRGAAVVWRVVRVTAKEAAVRRLERAMLETQRTETREGRQMGQEER